MGRKGAGAPLILTRAIKKIPQGKNELMRELNMKNDSHHPQAYWKILYLA